MESYGIAAVGAVQSYAGRSDPGNGWLLADGRSMSRSAYATLFAAICPSLGTFTVTVAAPGVFTLAGHGLLTGDSVILSTTGALPTGLATDTVYYARDITTNTFTLSATMTATGPGAAITTSGTQSGVHSLRCCPYGLGASPATTFALPDHRGRYALAPDNMGTAQGAAARLTNTQAALGRSESGAENYTLQTGETGMPASHSHGGSTGAGSTGATNTGTSNMTSAGANINHTHNIGSFAGSNTESANHNHGIGYSSPGFTAGNTLVASFDGSYPGSYSSGAGGAGGHNLSGNTGNIDTNHQHTWNAAAQNVGGFAIPSALTIPAQAAAAAASAHNNMHNYLVANKIIRVV